MARLFPILLFCMPLALGGCGGQKPRSASAPLPPVASHPSQTGNLAGPVPAAEVMHLPGLGSVIGANAATLRRQFGDPRLDLMEGDARKLQFSGAPCVLDIFLYPPENGGEPRATHVDARRASDGKDVDRAQCVGALTKR